MNALQHPLLGRRPLREAPHITPFEGRPEMGFVQGRLHELCGPARRTLALWLAARLTGPVIWVQPGWSTDRLHASGVVEWIDPGRLLFVDAIRADDVLWALEESLRSGTVPLVVGDLPGLPGLTQVRRMHLAAETGGQEGNHLPLGLLLTEGQGGAQGVESRWHLAPDHAAISANGPPGASPAQWHLSRLRARTAPQARWRVVRTVLGQHKADRRLDVQAA